MAYFGDTMAHSALLGVAISFLFSIDITIGVFVVAASVGGAASAAEARRAVDRRAARHPVAFHAGARPRHGRLHDLDPGRPDGLSVRRHSCRLALGHRVIYVGGLVIRCIVAWLWRPLLASTVNEELAEAEGLSPERSRLIFMLLMALVIAIAMKIVGILLITALLIIPAATARRFAATPEQMAVVVAALALFLARGRADGGGRQQGLQDPPDHRRAARAVRRLRGRGGGVRGRPGPLQVPHLRKII
jgi:zinc transport system permease protein